MRVRLLPWSVAGGPVNMAEDEALLDSADEGVASLRFYGWSEPTLSLGYFQPSAPALAYPGLAGLPWLRRHSGGAALVHHHELTYALALPAGASGTSWIARLHGYVQSALARLGVESSLCEREEKLGEVLCFRHHTPGDLIVGGHKVAGSAQRKRRGALLQHGGILLARSVYTPELPGLAELTGGTVTAAKLQRRLLEVLREEAGWHVEPGDWAAAERESLPGRIAARYGSPLWNARR
ncbi:MAG: lipoate--protein ligase family protein [Gemmataceae bacterium]